MSVYDYFDLALTLPHLKINCEQNSFFSLFKASQHILHLYNHMIRR